jgi:MerR family transcriptional regulator, light-induced transcriptional regulator
VQPTPAEVCAFASRGDRDGMRTALYAARANNPDVADFIERVLAPTQRRLGSMWEQQTLREEQAADASLIVGAILDQIATAADGADGSRPRVAVACPLNEWHELPARMIAAVLRAEDRWGVTNLGASVSPERLEHYARTERPLAIALSCTMPANLVSAADAIATAHKSGAFVIVGGAAFGATDRRAIALGADQWCPNSSAIVRILRVWERHPPDLAAHAIPSLGAALSDRHRAEVVDAALRSLGRSTKDADHGAQMSAKTAGPLRDLLGLAEAAVVTNDDSVVLDGVAWWWRATRPNRVYHAGFPDSALDALVAALEPGELRSMLLRARDDNEKWSVEQGSPLSGDERAAFR